MAPTPQEDTDRALAALRQWAGIACEERGYDNEEERLASRIRDELTALRAWKERAMPLLQKVVDEADGYHHRDGADLRMCQHCWQDAEIFVAIVHWDGCMIPDLQALLAESEGRDAATL